MTDEQKKYILDNWNSMTSEALRHAFNEKFGTTYKVTAFHYHTSKMGLRKMPMHHYSKEEDEFLKKYSSIMSRKELTAAFNDKFGTTIDIQALTVRSLRIGAVASNDGRFKTGELPWDRLEGGRDEWYAKYKVAPHHSFPKGHIPASYRPVGSQRIDSQNGRVIVKTEDGSWKSQQMIAWEDKYGKIPKGLHLLSVTGDVNDTDVNNLRLIDNATQTLLIANRWHDKGSDIFDAGVQYAKLYFLLRKEMGLNHYDFRTRLYMSGEHVFND